MFARYVYQINEIIIGIQYIPEWRGIALPWEGLKFLSRCTHLSRHCPLLPLLPQVQKPLTVLKVHHTLTVSLHKDSMALHQVLPLSKVSFRLLILWESSLVSASPWSLFSVSWNSLLPPKGHDSLVFLGLVDPSQILCRHVVCLSEFPSLDWKQAFTCL